MWITSNIRAVNSFGAFANWTWKASSQNVRLLHIELQSNPHAIGSKSREKARRGELIVSAPVGYVKSENRLEKHPDRRVQEAVLSVYRRFSELGTVRQTLLWFLEHDLQLPVQTVEGEI